MSKENEALIKYFETYMNGATESMVIAGLKSGNYGVLENLRGRIIAYEHVIDILKDKELREKELKKLKE